jgi:hypothetical protein
MAESGTRSTIERVDDGNSPAKAARAWALLGYKQWGQDRWKKLNCQIQEIDTEVEKKQASFLSKIARFTIAALGSIVPGTGGSSQVLDDVHLALVKKRVRKRYPGLNAMFNYERVLSSLSSHPRFPRPTSEVTQNYQPVKHWDEF